MAKKLLLAVGVLLSTHSLSFGAKHSPKEDAELIERAREEEKIFRELNRQSPEILACKYVSDISTAPPAKRIALTFDDGPDAEGTPYVLAVLQKYKIRATFFMKGESATEHPDLARRVAAAGNLLIGNHSWDHPSFHKISVAAQATQLKNTRATLAAYQTQKFFRYPYGNATCETNKLAKDIGYKIVGWHIDSCDWAFNETGAVTAKQAELCEVQTANRKNFRGHVLERAKKRNGGIILMHETQPNTIRQLDKLIEELLHAGFTFGTLSEAGFQPSLR